MKKEKITPKKRKLSSSVPFSVGSRPEFISCGSSSTADAAVAMDTSCLQISLAECLCGRGKIASEWLRARLLYFLKAWLNFPFYKENARVRFMKVDRDGRSEVICFCSISWMSYLPGILKKEKSQHRDGNRCRQGGKHYPFELDTQKKGPGTHNILLITLSF